MIETKNKIYDLEERSFKFAQNIAQFCKNFPKTQANFIYLDQLIRSSSSQGANYIEANESLSKKNFVMRMKICRKETKESIYWLRLVEVNSEKLEQERQTYIQEATELKKIYCSIIDKSEN